MNSSRYRGVRCTVLLGAIFAVSVPAYAGLQTGHAERTTASVRVVDLDLSIDADVATLYKRLKRAARAVCGPLSLRGAGSLTHLRINRQCYAQVLDQSVAKTGSRSLSALHAS